MTPEAAAISPSPIPAPGSSALLVSGEIALRVTQDFQCSSAGDDFLVRGGIGSVGGVPVYLSINIESYKGPGGYPAAAQVLVRRTTTDNRVYASWHDRQASGTVLPNGGGLDLALSAVPPEPGTDATRPISIHGHLACVWRASGPA